MQVNIPDIKIIIYHRHENVRIGFITLEPYEEESQFAISFVAQHIELLCLGIKYDIADKSNLVELIKIYLSVGFQIAPDAVIGGCYDESPLLRIRDKMVRLTFQSRIECVHHLHFLGREVHFEDTLHLGKNDGVRILARLWVLKEEFHTYSSELRKVANQDSFDYFELVIIHGIFRANSFQNDQLIKLLFLLNQVFTRDDSEEIFISGLLHAQDLIFLPCF